MPPPSTAAPLRERRIARPVGDALADTPVVLIVGPRQSGKTTLCRTEAQRRGFREYSLDDAAILGTVAADPGGFIASLDAPAFIDEIQLAPELLPAIKLAVDRKRAPGRFLLTGSADVLALPRVTESLAGRVEILELWPLSQGEISGAPDGFVAAIFSRARPPAFSSRVTRAAVLELALRGGYPEAVARPGAERRTAWFRSYISTIMQRDVRALAQIAGLTDLPRVLSLIASRSPALLNIADLSRDSGIAQTTLQRYVAVLERLFLVRRVPAWAGNRGKRIVRTPRAFIPDSGLLAHLAGLDTATLREHPTLAGPLLECFVGAELLKQGSWGTKRAALLHYRTHSGREVDWVLESESGAIVGVEVKAAARVTVDDTRGLVALREAAGKRFHCGVVLYTGTQTLPLGDGLWAMPMSAVWGVE